MAKVQASFAAAAEVLAMEPYPYISKPLGAPKFYVAVTRSVEIWSIVA